MLLLNITSMAKKRKTANDYFRNPSETCAKWVLNQQRSEIPPSVGDEGARARLTKQWCQIQRSYSRARKTQGKSVK